MFTGITNFRALSRRKMTNKQHFKVCFCFQIMFHLQVAEPPEEIRTIFGNYSQNGNMNVDNVRRFLVEFQGEKDCDATKKMAQAIFESHKHLNLFHRKGLHVDAFFCHLLGDHNGPLREEQHEMNHPLAHYFLYTGHNSYLTGNQFSSESSASPIIKALKKGVRVIELDLWPNRKKNDVEVRHGGTLTKPVKLKACLNAIKDYAFYASKYPVVITFEDHIAPPLQSKAAKMVNEIFGEMLFRPHDSQHMKDEHFLTPESLKEKILISTKLPENPEVQEEGTQRFDSHEVNSKQHDSGDLVEEDNALGYKDLISIHAGKPKGNVEKWLHIHNDNNNNACRRVSLSEPELEAIVKTHGTQVVRFTQENLLRIYPKGTRVDSSNYDPMVGWMHGTQMVAFNMQGHDHFLWMMEGMFRGNGGCGYVKKPDILLNDNEVFDPTASRQIQKTLQVKIYMGEGWHIDFPPTHFDCCSPPDFSVQLHIHGVPKDTKTVTTGIVADQWVPVWNQEFSFSLTVPELALLCIKVKEQDLPRSHDFGGQTCLPVSQLREGIRSIRLCNHKGQPYTNVRLLVHFRFTTNKSVNTDISSNIGHSA